MHAADFTIYRVTLVRDGAVQLRHPMAGRTIHHSRDAAEVVAAYLQDAAEERFVVLWMDRKNHLIGMRTVAVGTLSEAAVHPREVFTGVCDGRVASIVLAHNHLGMDSQPSQPDRVTTHRLVQVGHLLGVPVLDHVIVAFRLDGSLTHYSFADEGCLSAEPWKEKQ